MKVVRRDPSKGYIDSWLWVPKAYINVNATQSALNFVFTDSYTGNQKVLSLWRETPHHLLVPRAFWDPATLPFDVIDCRPMSYAHVEFKSRVLLDHRIALVDGEKKLMPTGDNVQQLSLNAMCGAMGGVLQLACGAGKTVVALEKIARGKVPALIMLDNMNLLKQWADDIEEFLDVPGGIGELSAGKYEWKKGIVLATYHSVAARADEMTEEARRWFGQIFWDEAHHVNAPVFSKSADLFYGKRYALTATPRRDDGLHIICDFHIGRVLHRDLRQAMKPRIIFKWTGIKLNLSDPLVSAAVLDKNKEVHLSKVKSYFGGWRERLWMTMQDAIDAAQVGRKVLVLSDSIDEVVNLLTMWVRGPHAPLYSEIPIPTPQEVGATVAPLELSVPEGKKLLREVERLETLAAMNKADPKVLANRQLEKEQFECYSKIQRELEKRQRAFLKQLINEPSTAGVMTFGVPAAVRQAYVKDKQVIFAITKYGKEGLDCPDLDTVIVSTPFSSKNSMQQLMGRPTRPKPGKKMPLVIIYEDEIGQMIGMCQKLKKHLRAWPHEEGGPFEFELLGHKGSSCNLTLKQVFGQS